MTDALLELAHREYTIGDYKNAEAHCKQVTFRLIMTLQLYVTSPPIPRLFCVKRRSYSTVSYIFDKKYPKFLLHYIYRTICS